MVKRTKNARPLSKPTRLPDIIVQAPMDSYTMVPNKVIRNPELSWRAKGLLTLLLGNRQGWHSYQKTIVKLGKDGTDSVRSGLRELTEAGHLFRIKYTDKKDQSNQIKGTVWICVADPDGFDAESIAYELERHGLKPLNTALRNTLPPKTQDLGTHVVGNPRLIKRKEIRTNSNKTLENARTDARYLLEQFPKEWQEDKTFQSTVLLFAQHRREIKKRLTKKATEMLARNLVRYPMWVAIQAMEESVANGWQGCFPESIKKNGAKKPYQNCPTTRKTIYPK